MASTVTPIGLNLRNHLISRYNPKESIYLAKDKGLFKKFLIDNNIATPKLFANIRYVFRIDEALQDAPDQFVIKPSKGSRGSGILVLERKGNNFITPSGKEFALVQVRAHVRKILEGQFSQNYEGDAALFEERIYSSKVLMMYGAVGLPDIRIFCYNYKPIMAMLRLPTKKSGGKANLSQGAWGVGIDMSSGRATSIYSKMERKYYDLERFPNFVMPHWEDIKKISAHVSKLAKLKISGIDIVLNQDNIPLVLEANSHPGIEIQNVNKKVLILI